MTFVFFKLKFLCENTEEVNEAGTVALGTEERIVVAFQEILFFLPDNLAAFRANEVFGRFTEFMILITLVVFHDKGMAVRALPAYITGCHTMDKANDILLVAAVLTMDSAGTAHMRKTQILLVGS